MGKPEAQVEAYLVKRIKAIGGEIRKAQWIAHRGCPDRRAMLPKPWRLHLHCMFRTGFQNPWVECKAPGEELEEHQVREINRMRNHGELVLVIDSREDVDRYFPPKIEGVRM